MDSLLEKGVRVSFNDDGAFSLAGFPTVSNYSLISVNGVNILMYLPGAEERYPDAAEAQRRTQSQASPPPAP